MHTPGPWKALKRGVNDEHVILPLERHRSAESWYIASTTGNVPEDAANARLIAQAPELLTLLEESLIYVEECESFHKESCRTLSARIKAAIHAATH